MACMEHTCKDPKCDWFGMDNKLCQSCPKCGGEVWSTCDEHPEDDDIEEDYDES